MIFDGYFAHTVTLIIFLLLVTVFYIVFRLGGRVTDDMTALEKDITYRLEYVEAGIVDRLIEMAKGDKERDKRLSSLSEVIGQSLGDALNRQIASIQEHVDGVAKAQQQTETMVADIKKLLAQQGVYLHDRFAQLSSADDKQAATTQALLQRLHSDLSTSWSNQSLTDQAQIRKVVDSAISQLMSSTEQLIKGFSDQQGIALRDRFNQLSSADDKQAATTQALLQHLHSDLSTSWQNQSLTNQAQIRKVMDSAISQLMSSTEQLIKGFSAQQEIALRDRFSQLSTANNEYAEKMQGQLQRLQSDVMTYLSEQTSGNRAQLQEMTESTVSRLTSSVEQFAKDFFAQQDNILRDRFTYLSATDDERVEKLQVNLQHLRGDMVTNFSSQSTAHQARIQEIVDDLAHRLTHSTEQFAKNFFAQQDNTLRNQLTRLSSADSERQVEIRGNFQQVCDGLVTTLSEQIKGKGNNHQDYIGGSVQQVMVAVGDLIKDLFAQQDTYLHNRLTYFSASENERADKVRHSLQQIRDELIANLSNQAHENRAQLKSTVDGTMNEIGDSINRLTIDVEARFSRLSDRINTNFSDGLSDTVESFRSLQKQISTLVESNTAVGTLGKDVVSLSRTVLARGDWSTKNNLSDLLAMVLPEEVYELDVDIDGNTATALLAVPDGDGSIAIDASLALDEMDNILNHATDVSTCQEARQRLNQVLVNHIHKVADAFLLAETNDVALLFVTSEAAFAEIQANHRQAVQLAASRRVWLVSPTTLLAVLNMARGIIRDYRAKRQLEEVQDALQMIVDEAQRFENRLLEIGDHINHAMRSVRRAESAGIELFSHARSIAGGVTMPAIDEETAK